MGAAPDLNKPQAFNNVPLQMMIDKTSTFRHIFHKNLHHIQVFNFRSKRKNGSGTLLPLPASSSASTFQVTTLPNAAFYPRKNFEKAKTSGAPSEFLSD